MQMNTNTIITVIVLIVIAVGGYFYFTAKDAQAPENGDAAMMDNEGAMVEDNMSGETVTDENSMEEAEVQTVVVMYTDNGYEPATVTISQGGTVTFINQSSRDMWTATAIHPTHTVYPGSDIKKCDTAPEGTLFDACGGIAPGGSFSFTFNESGEWGYHDHLNPRSTGKIVVQ